MTSQTAPALKRISRRSLSRSKQLAGGLAALVAFGSAPAPAQNLPGVVLRPASPEQGIPQAAPAGIPGVMMPRPMAPPQAAPAPQAPPQQQAQPKPKPKPKPKPVAAKPAEGAAAGVKGSAAGTAIALLVNGDPITNYEIDQRARLLGLQTDIRERAQENMKRMTQTESVNARWKEIVEETIKQHQATKTREQIIAIIQEKQKAFSMGLQKQAVEAARASVMPAQREQAKKELIEEAVKLQFARKEGATPDEATVETIVKDIAQRNKLSVQQFTEHFASQGVDISTFKAKFRAQQAWADAIRRRFGHMVQTSNRDIDRLVQKGGEGEDTLELQLQRIVVPLPAKMDQNSTAQRLAEAEQLHRQFAGCKTLAGLAAKMSGARVENMGPRKPGNFNEPVRTMLLNAKDDEMIPPHLTSGGIDLIAVCSRKVIKASDELRQQKAAEIRQEEFERISRKHLRDVMADAVIENR